MISVLILTLNEEANLPACLKSVEWSDDVVILDSGSDDHTVEIAHSTGARIFHRPFDNEKDHRTFSLRGIPFKYPWVYNPDADEVTPKDLRDEMLDAVSDPTRQEVAYRVRFKAMFMGKWMRYSSLYPTWVMRLFRPEKIRFERVTNLNYIADGKVGFLKSHYLHYSFNKGFYAWFGKHNNYSSLEAIEAVKCLTRRIDYTGLLSVDSVHRRRALKEFSCKLPFRPALRFYYMYFLRKGFLDGWAGYTYCRLLSIYEHMVDLKIKEIQRRERGLPI